MAGKIEKLGHNHYRVRWYDKTGKRRCKTVHGTRAAAQQVKAEIELELSGAAVSRTFDEYWAAVVLPSLDGLSKNTRDGYIRFWGYVSRMIGGMDVSEIDWKDVQSVVDSIDSPTLQRKAFAVLRKVCNMAIRDRLLRVNPCDRSIRFKQHIKRNKVLIEVQDVKPLMDEMRGMKYEPIVLCLIGGGLRPEEADALTWGDIEPLEMNGKVYALVSVTKTIVLVKGGTELKDGTKTASSTRFVVIGEPFASRLLKLKGNTSDFICQGPNGKPSSPMTITHNWKYWCERRGIPYVSQENMRSSWATMQGEAGSPDSLVSMGMGHTDGTTKGKNYQQATLRGLALIADNLADYIAAQ